jgi:hypothetical protein
MKNLLLCVLLITLFSSCGGKNYYLSPSFKSKAQAHKTIAVLPYAVMTNGTQPKDLTPERKLKIEEEEALAFQQSLYNSLTSNLGKSRLQIQLPNKTNNLLRAKGISLTRVAQSNPEDLAKMLGVDAVVFATVIKNRYLDDLTSAGISAGSRVLSFATKGLVEGASSKTNDVKLTCSLIEARDGDVLWKIDGDATADWSKTANVVIDRLNQVLSVDFPYKSLKNK